MPSEWNRHSATQLQWPSAQSKWNAERLIKVEELYCRFIEELHFFEPIHLFVDDLEMRNHVMQRLSGRAVDLDRITVHQKEMGCAWARDCGSVFMKHGSEFVIYDFDPEEHPSIDMNGSHSDYLAEKSGLKKVIGELILRNNWLDSNGAGALLVLESPMLEHNKANGFSKPEIEQKLKKEMRCEDIFWVKSGSDDVELPARWLNVDTVMITLNDNVDEDGASDSQENVKVLKSAALEKGKKLNVETLKQAAVEKNDEPEDTGLHSVLGSYTGFYIANGAVFTPKFKQEEDTVAVELFKRYFPGRKIIGIDCTDLAMVKGSFRRISLPFFSSKMRRLS